MILNAIPSKVIKFLSEVESLDFKLCLVGGAVRNYLLQKDVGNDFDFEVRSQSEITNDLWESKFDLIIELAKSFNYKFEKLPYLIIRISIDQYSLEFSSPRTEKFIIDNHEHHNFEAILSSNLSYNEAFKRRDFTINAIGMEFDLKNNSCKLVDPFEGKKDLESKTLDLISVDFFCDSVRFIRLIRFKILLNFSISKKIEINLKKFNLSKLSDFHFKQEAQKANLGSFLNQFIELVKNQNLALNEKFSVYKKVNFLFPDDLKSFEQIVYFALFDNESIAGELNDFFNLPKNNFTKAQKMKLAILYFSELENRELANSVNYDLQIFKTSKIYNQAKVVIDNLILFKNMIIFSKTKTYINLDDFEKIKSYKVSDNILNSIPPELRNVYLINEGLKNVIK